MGFCGIERVLWRVFFFFNVFQASKGKRKSEQGALCVPPRSPTPASCSPEKREKQNPFCRLTSHTSHTPPYSL